MLRDLVPGKSYTIEAVVRDDMCATFEGRTVHPVYATWWLVYHMELAGRMLLEPHLEPHENGVGGGISVEHRAPALVGTRVRVTATVESNENGKLWCAVIAESATRTLAEGRFLQIILAKERIASIFAAAERDVARSER
ncbi:MAG: hypothetical protein SF069_11990 [Phycisphaerae bacterium]|nr:hypothetical protein [Phycisphaerae bacterium]